MLSIDYKKNLLTPKDYIAGGDMDQFTWIPIYKEIAPKLLEYKDKQDNLLRILATLKKENLPIIGLKDRDNTGEVPLTEIDPFTFYANWNRGITDENRKEILKRLKDIFNLTSDLPEDFSGIPVVPLTSSWFFGWKKDRNPNDISILWDLFQDVVEDNDISERFNSALNIKFHCCPR